MECPAAPNTDATISQGGLHRDIWVLGFIWRLDVGCWNFLSSGRFTFRRSCSLISTTPREQKHQSDSGANRAIGHIERRKTDLAPAALLHVKIKEVDHVSGVDAINQIPNDTATDQPECKLAKQGAGIKMMPGEKQNNQRDAGNDRQ